jgi:hypothetical protein
VKEIAERSLPVLLVLGIRDWPLAGQVASYDKVKQVISKFTAYKSLADDGIFLALLLEGTEVIISLVMKTFKACIALGYVPLSWRVVKSCFYI